MAVISLNRKVFEKEIGKLTDELQEKIALFGTPIENLSDNEIQIEIFPNRPDLLSMQGYIRAFRSFLGKGKGLKEYSVKQLGKEFVVDIEKSVKEIRPYTVCAILKNLSLNEDTVQDIIDLQEKLHATLGRKRKKSAIGIYPLEKIKFPIKLTAIEPDKIKFIPLGADEEMSGLQILQKHPAGREYANLLAGKRLFPVFIDENKEILSMPPIINSERTGKINAGTKEVFVECSGFDLQTLEKCLNIIVTALAEIGGVIYSLQIKSPDIKIITPNLKPEKMKFNKEEANKILGVQLKEREIKDCLERMGFNYDAKKNLVEIPAWRTDVLHEIDLIEDIAIAYGYERFIPKIPAVATIGKESRKEEIKQKIAEILIGLNIIEVSNYHLTTKEDQYKKLGIKIKEKELKEISDAKTQYTILRKDISHQLLKILAENVDAEYPHMIFEAGRVFQKSSEEERLAVALSPGNFTEIKQRLLYLMQLLDIPINVKNAAAPSEYFIEGRAGDIMLEGKEVIGNIGEIHPRVLRNLKIKMPVALFEINLEEIFKKLRD
jgi:phenylalanyl-tRNA synthetase beta chain